MSNANTRPRSGLCALLCVSVLSGFCLNTSAFAEEGVIEEVIVTGSRIARDPNLGAAGPVQSLSAEDIRLSGETEVVDVLREMPALLTSISSDGSTDSVFAESITSVGENTLQLRGMGTERTLVLVNGRRHVSGIEGSQAVDVGTIPPALIERVEVLTGGASAVYGADAVTGVVNFILKDDFEGMDLNLSQGISGDGDGETTNLSALFGANFADGRGNITVGFDYLKKNDLKFDDRGWSKNNGVADDLPNPALRFQTGDISTSTPNFEEFYSFDNGNYPVGFSIPSVEEFEVAYEDAFGTAPNLTADELALIDRAESAPLRSIQSQPTFSISSNRGVIAPANFGLDGVDVNGNGTDDCLDSSVGFQSLLVDDVNSFGFAGGCWVANDDGTVSPYQDGQISGVFNQFGGDGIQNNFNRDRLVPDETKVSINVTGHYDITDTMTVFGEAKYVRQDVEWGGPLNTFYDLLTVSPENPFIPAQLQQVAQDNGGLFITRDPTDLGPNISKNNRDTYRFVLGLEGEFANGWNYETSVNIGHFERRFDDRNAVIQDRWFAAIDVVADPVTGAPICRSDIDDTPPPTTPFGIPLFDPSFLTFNPGDGQCRPANILSGPGAISQEAIDFITQTTTDKYELDQLVLNATVSGQLDFFELPGGSIGFALGADYRKEQSSSDFDPLALGVLPVTTDFGAEGELVRDIDGLAQNSLIFDPETLYNNSNGEYDVWELFGELSLPILQGAFLAEELTLDLAGRYSDYDTIGSTWTWSVGGSWSPIEDIRFRGTVARAVRAPNIFELYEPDQGATFRPDDPCDQAVLDALNDPNRTANCRADGIPVGYNDPLSARFSGVVSGNEDLEEEEADTYTVGFVLQPRFLDGLDVSVDYWNIEIDNAIDSVAAQDIVDNCYDSSTFPNQFCTLFNRNSDPDSPQFRGFNFLRQTQLNFGSIKSEGVDFSTQYGFAVGDNDFLLSVGGTWVDNLDYYFDPADSSVVDPELGEIQRPEWSANGMIQFNRGPLTARWSTMYQDEQGLRAVEIESVDVTYGDAGITSDVWVHDISGSWDFGDSWQLYGGVNNLTDEDPFITEQAWPVNPRGRYFFLGINYQGGL